MTDFTLQSLLFATVPQQLIYRSLTLGQYDVNYKIGERRSCIFR